jgi:diguanylate cyclase (GGDEF)-like protein/PAS domain S-box-containing protein
MESPLQDFHEAIIILDNNNQIIGVNPVGEQLLKMKKTDLIGKSIDILFPRQSSSEYRKEILVDGRKEVSLSCNDGQSVYAEITISTISGLDGEHVGRVVLVRDNIQAQQSKMRIKQEEALRTQNLMLTALQETTYDLHASLDLDIVLHNIVERACKLLETTHGYLDILRETGELEPVVGIGALEESLKHKITRGEGVAGKVWKTGKPLLISDYDNWSERIEEFQKNLIRAILGMPLILKGKVVGVIGVARGAEIDKDFSEDDISILRRFAELAVVALQNARLFEKAQKEIDFRRKTEIELRNSNQVLQLQIERVEMLQEQLQELAVRDPLTELYNRRYLQEALEMEFAHPERSNLPLAILMMDSDHLKEINDKYGHKAGDDFLVYIAEEIQRGIRAGDIACRYGGDEFVVVLSNVSEEIALERAEKLRETIAAHHIVHRNEEVGISVSIGIAMFPAHGRVGEILLHRADHALYDAKRMGKNKVCIYKPEQ